MAAEAQAIPSGAAIADVMTPCDDVWVQSTAAAAAAAVAVYKQGVSASY
jgi:hypothetical protein